MTEEVLQALLDELRAGRPAACATLVRASGSTPRQPGARMLVRQDGSTVGTIGGGAFEAMVVADARQWLAEAAGPRTMLRRYTFTERGEDALGMACGGQAEVFLELHLPAERLIVFGAGHVGLAVARLAAQVGFRVEIVDDRPDSCAKARALGTGPVHRCEPEYTGKLPDTDARTYVAVLTRCHRTDRNVLERVLGRPARYVGLIGSRRKRHVIFEELRARGVAEEQLARVRCPIGLPLGGDRPEEIAVSIVAELIQERHARASEPMSTLPEHDRG